jgi:hypothetical protein
VSPLPQPVNTALMTTPNSTINANILFIVGVRFTKSSKMTSTIFRSGLSAHTRVLGGAPRTRECAGLSGPGRLALPMAVIFALAAQIEARMLRSTSVTEALIQHL